MLAVTRISPGGGYRYLTEQVAAGRHDLREVTPGGPAPYYLDHTAHGEAHGWWAGRGAQILDVSGVVTLRQMERLIGHGRHPQTGGQLGRIWRLHPPMTDPVRLAAVQKALDKLPDDATVEQRDKVWHDIMTRPDRHAVSGYDVTVSPVKSVSVLWAFGDDRVKAQVMAAHHAGVRTMLSHLERHGAFTRVGANGVRQVETAGLAAMVFDHRMSRERDPQLHAHVVVSSKVQTVGVDGRPQWLALDGRAFYQATVGARAAYERAVEGELTQRLGVRFAARTGSTIREVVGVSGASLRQYAKRRSAIEQEMQHRTTGPDGARRRLLDGSWRRRAQDATLRTRTPQRRGESTVDAVRRWHTEDRRAGLDTAAQVRDVVGGRVDEVGQRGERVLRRTFGLARDRTLVAESDLHATAAALGVPKSRRADVVAAAVRLDPRLAAIKAVQTLSQERATFGREHLELAIGQVLHIDATRGAAHDWDRVQRLADQVITSGIGGLRVLTPPALVDFKPSLQRGIDGQSQYTRHRDLTMTTRAVLAAEHHVIAYAGRRGAAPAPTAVLYEITTALRLSPEKAQALRVAVGDDRRVTAIIGPAGTGKTYLQRAVAAAAQRADIPVIGLTVGQNAANNLAAATEHDGARMRTENVAMWLHAQRKPPAGTTTADWAFAPGQRVIIDEASQISTHDLARLVTLLEPVGGKLVMVGDPEQVSAVGPGGLLRHIAGLGAAVHLTEVHRFANDWEGPASLRLRTGDITVLADYDRRGRIIGGHREHLITQMIDGWAADRAAGRRTLMLVGTEAEAATIAEQARSHLVRAGVVSTTGQIRLANDTHVGVGDIIVTRRNDRRLTTKDGTWVANRDQWRVHTITPDGHLQATNLRTGQRQDLPDKYAAQHVQLAYAGTVDSAQGQTVHTARALVDDRTALARLYVMLTRGTQLNEAYVVTDDEPREGTPPLPPSASVEVLADIMRRAKPERSATETEQQLWADIDALHAWGPIYDDLAARAQARHYLSVVADIAGQRIADRLAGDLALPALITRLRTLAAGGYDPRQVLERVISPRELNSADDIAAVLSWRVDSIIGTVTADPRAATAPQNAGSFTARLPDLSAGGDIVDALRQVADLCDKRVTALTDLATQQLLPAWAAGLGPVPEDDAARRQWDAAARLVVTYRDRYQITGDDPIGPEPMPQSVDQWGAWHRARIALGTSTLTGHLAAVDDPQLQQLITAQRRADAAAPAYVGDQLRDAHLNLAGSEQTVRQLQHLIADVENAGRPASQQVQERTPRWWHRGPSRTRILTQQAEAQQRVQLAAGRITDLRGDLRTATTTVEQDRSTVGRLESQHSTWARWYVDALPIRYAGLAAHAEQTRRLSTRIAGLSQTVAAATAKVRAVDDMRQQPHIHPVPDDLAEQAEAAYARTTEPEIDVRSEGVDLDD